MTLEENASVAEVMAPWDGLFPFEGAVWANGSTAAETLKLPTFSAGAKARVAITLGLCVISTACNVAVLWAGMGKPQSKRSQARLLLLHLAAADLLVALVVMPVDAAWNVTLQWRAGDWACRLLMFLRLLAMYASAFVTAIISLDRQDAILHPLTIAKARHRSQVLLHASWLLSAGLSIPQLFLFRTVTISSPQNFTQCTTRGAFTQRWHETAYNMLSFLCLFLLPLLIMVACYSRILLEISRRIGSSSCLSAKELPLRRSRNPIPRARLRMLRLSMAIVGSFVVCWTPYYLLGLWYWFWPDAMEGAVSHSVAHILFCFGLLNSSLDPILYGLFTLPLRQRRGGCCWAGGPGSSSQLPSSVTSHCSASSIRLQRGVPHLELAAEAPLPPSACTKDIADSSGL
ncbi:gonadotropin-releasing hormone II receptor-like [Lacerta agilis]|uniref:gonadotropin-releasing hormone II receptor-like n=1 Tax=Lacerta agilis TaxID=80427 RepID=UPI001419AF6D|nr:gonadotropin-releasing hormone II receptor-like [Lacerta agilis]